MKDTPADTPGPTRPAAAAAPGLPTDPVAGARADGWPGRGPGTAVGDWARASAAAARDAPVPGPGLAAPAAAALPGLAAPDHGNQRGNGGEGFVRFGSIDQWDWDCKGVPCGDRPTEWDEGYPYSDEACAGWGPSISAGPANGRLAEGGPPQDGWHASWKGGGGGSSYPAHADVAEVWQSLSAIVQSESAALELRSRAFSPAGRDQVGYYI